MPDDSTEAVRKAFQEALNRHGYSFQQAVLDQASKTFDAQKSPWKLVVSEIPVSCGKDRQTQIDILLRHRVETPFYLIGECKRVNPAWGHWCFAKAPHVRANYQPETYFFDHLVYKNDRGPRAYVGSQTAAQTPFNIGLEVKSQHKGDAQSPGKSSSGAIEDAATQVLTGLNGYINLLADDWVRFKPITVATFLPVIFTTANLWKTDLDLTKASIESGNIEWGAASFEPADWIPYQYERGAALAHSVPVDSGKALRQADLGEEYLRTIFVVRASAIASFLEWATPDTLF